MKKFRNKLKINKDSTTPQRAELNEDDEIAELKRKSIEDAPEKGSQAKRYLVLFSV